MASKLDKKVKEQEQEESSRVWSVMSLFSGLLAAVFAKKVLDGGLAGRHRQDPAGQPGRPGRRHLGGRGLGDRQRHRRGVARMLATRRAASYYARSTGHLPPEPPEGGQDAAAVARRRVAAEAVGRRTPGAPRADAKGRPAHFRGVPAGPFRAVLCRSTVALDAVLADQLLLSASWLRWCTRKQLMQVNSSS